jgi:uncharacterized protein
VTGVCATASPPATVWRFAGVLCLLSLPFWALGAVMASPTHLPLQLPASALMVVCPYLAALVLRHRSATTFPTTSTAVGGDAGLVWAVAILAMPAGLALSWSVMRSAGHDLPLVLPGLAEFVAWCALFLLAAVAEEVGWTTYLTARLYPEWGLWRTGVTVGSIWGAWHLVPFLQAGRGAGWIAGQVVASIFMRVIMVGLFVADGRRTRTAVVFHLMVNLSIASFPVQGSNYEPLVTAPVLAFLAVATVAAFERRGLLTSQRATRAPAT